MTPETERSGARPSMRIGVITFPGTLDDVDAARAISYAGGEPVGLWHDDAAYDAAARDLAALFRRNFERFGQIAPEILAAGPQG